MSSLKAQKSSLTREINQLKAYILDLKAAYQSGRNKGQLYGWLHGDRVFSWTIQKVETELTVLEVKRKKLDK